MLCSMKGAFSSVVLFVALWNSAFGQSGPLVTATRKPLFTFHNGFWTNMHHFLYVLGRARNGTADSQRSAVMHAPEGLEDFDALNKRDQTLGKRAAPVYRLVWWDRHSAPRELRSYSTNPCTRADAMIPLLDSTAQRLNVKIPRDLFHSLNFCTAGYVVSRIVPGHRPYAEPLLVRGALPGRTQLNAHGYLTCKVMDLV